MDREPGKGTQERCFVTWPSMAAANPASTRHREINFQTCFLAISEHIWKIWWWKYPWTVSPHLICVCSHHWYLQICTGGWGWQALSPTAASSWLGGQELWGRIRGHPELSLDMQTADAITSQPWSSLLSLPDFTPVKAVASKIFPRDCTHLAGVLLEMGNYCIHKNPPKWEV